MNRFSLTASVCCLLVACGSTEEKVPMTSEPCDVQKECEVQEVPDVSPKKDAAQAPDLSRPDDEWGKLDWGAVCPEWSANWPTLAEKTAFLDDLVVKQHLVDGLLRTVTLDKAGQLSALHQLPSTGLWTAMYLASQSYRWATTGEPQALENARKAVEGLHHLTAVTGSSGLYGRSYHRPDFDYAQQPSPGAAWTESTVPGYEGWWFNFTVSKDTMDGIMYGYATALELLEDEEILATVKADVLAFANHLVGNGLQIIDYDGKVTEHGRMYYSAMDDFPGFNAILVAAWLQTAIHAGAGPDIEHFYYDCLMRVGDMSDCPDIEVADLGSYMDAIETMLSLYMYDCKTNFDHFDMVFQAVEPLLKRETHPELRQRLRNVLEVGIWKSGDPLSDPSVAESTHALYIFMYGALAGMKPGNTVFDQARVDSVCSLYAIPQDRTDRDIAAGTQEGVCLNRFGNPNAAHPIPVNQRYFDNYLWRLDSYEVPIEHTGNPDMVHSPEDYLLAYWMGRYYGFLSPDM